MIGNVESRTNDDDSMMIAILLLMMNTMHHFGYFVVAAVVVINFWMLMEQNIDVMATKIPRNKRTKPTDDAYSKLSD
jgi:hypothetical protein